ncbi:MAG: SLATT domain-containing protein [Candidatus Methylumidiphilus sp.]
MPEGQSHELLPTIKLAWAWLWCLGVRQRRPKDATEKLQMSMRVTAKSRYNAAARLQFQSKFAFFATTLLSLGLILIPLMQNAAIPLAFKANVLNMVQLFLAVASLVYSVVIGTAQFDVRAEKLTECGNRLKDLIREIERDYEKSPTLFPDKLSDYQRRYSDVVTDSENHDRSDYHFAILEMSNDYFITGIPWIIMYVNAILSRCIAYIAPLLMMYFEVIFGGGFN